MEGWEREERWFKGLRYKEKEKRKMIDQGEVLEKMRRVSTGINEKGDT